MATAERIGQISSARNLLVVGATRPADRAGERWWAAGFTILALAAIEATRRSIYPIDSPGPLMVVIVACAAFRGGCTAGMPATALTALYAAWFYSIPGSPFQYGEGQLPRLCMLLAAMPPVCWMISTLKSRADLAAVDVSLRRQQAERRRGHEFMTLVKNSPDIICRIDRDLRHTYVNPAIEAVMGISPERMIGRTKRELGLPSALCDKADAAGREVFATGQERQFEFSIPAADGERQFRTRLVPERANDGSVESVMGITEDITDRRRAEAALRDREERLLAAHDAARASEERYRFLAEGLPQIVWTATAECQADYWNQRWYDFSGQKPAQAMGAGWLDSVHRDDVQTIRYLWSKAASGDAAHEAETRFRRADGDYRWHLVRVSPVRDEHSGAIRWIGTAMDIHDRKRAEAALSDAEQQLRLITDASPIFITYIDSDRRYRFVNVAYALRHGRTREDVLMRTVPDVVGAEAYAQMAPQLDLALSGKRISYEASIDYFTVGVRHLAIEYVPDIGSGGRVKGVVGIFSDLTERRQAEEALRRSDEQYRRIVETAQEGIWSIDALTRTTYVNERMAELLGYRVDELLGRPSKHYIFEADRQAVALRWLARDAGAKEQHEFRLRRKDGTAIWVHCSTTPLRDPLGCFIGAFGMFTDISERKRAEDELSQKVAELARHDNKLATLGLLVSGVAHEINNPANYITLSLPLLYEAWSTAIPILDRHHASEGDLSLLGVPYAEAKPQVVELFSGVDKGVQRIKRIVNELTNFAKKDGPFVMEPVSLNEVVKAAVALLDHQIRRSTRRFVCACAPDLPLVDGNFQRLEQVVINLVQNACQALSSPERAVTVTTRCQPEAGGIVVEIRDEGVGIPDSALQRVTEPFYTTKQAQGGTGLGLSIARTIVEEHGGSLRFASQENSGTTATVSIPLARQSTADSDRQVAYAGGTAASAAPGK